MTKPGFMSPEAASAFIRTETRVCPVPHAPEVLLHVADEAIPLWQKTEDELEAMGMPPPFWAFAWAGGQALARYLLDNPTIVAGKQVLDFASGSGLCGIAALKAGAAGATAADVDSFAIAAIALNAAANGVTLPARQDDLIGSDEGWDVVLAGDIFYEQGLAVRVFAWLCALKARGAIVLIGDPGRSYLPRERLALRATYQVRVTRALEDSDIKASSVWSIADEREEA